MLGPTYTTPLKYVLFWWRKSTHFWVCSRRVGKLWDILSSRNCVFNRGLCHICYLQPVTVNCPVNHLVTVNILQISFNLTSCHIREKRSSSLICQSRVFHAENSAHIFCIMMHLKVNDQMDVYKSSHCCCRLNIARITIKKTFFYQVKCWLLVTQTLFWKPLYLTVDCTHPPRLLFF